MRRVRLLTDRSHPAPLTAASAVCAVAALMFAQPLTNAGGTIPLIVNPNVAYTPYCNYDPSPTCTPPPANISQERFSLPDNFYNVPTAFYYRTIVSGTVTAQ